MVNPRKSRTARRKGATMPKKRGRKKTRRRAAPRRNPSTRKMTANPRRRTRRRRSIRAVSGKILRGLNLKQAIGDQIPIQLGILASQWTAKRFGPTASELDPTTWNAWSYAKGAAGALIAGIAGNLIKPGLGQKILLGGITHMTHRLVRNELIQRSTWATAQFGEDMDDMAELSYDEEGIYAGQLPIDDRHRLPAGMGLGQVVPVNQLGETVVEASPLGDDFSAYANAYQM